MNGSTRNLDADVDNKREEFGKILWNWIFLPLFQIRSRRTINFDNKSTNWMKTELNWLEGPSSFVREKKSKRRMYSRKCWCCIKRGFKLKIFLFGVRDFMYLSLLLFFFVYSGEESRGSGVFFNPCNFFSFFFFLEDELRCFSGLDAPKSWRTFLKYILCIYRYECAFKAVLSNIKVQL